jgi:integrase
VDLATGVIRVERSMDDKEGVGETKGRNKRAVPIPSLLERADEAWTGAQLSRVTLHECRHCYASYAIAAGVNAKALSTYMGHANISITLDLYGHMLPGHEEEAAGLLDA